MTGLLGLAPCEVWAVGDRSRVKIQESPPPPPTTTATLEKQPEVAATQDLRDGTGCTPQCPEAQS